jgi:methylenetetrahydrofolate reductase (NADPH)
MAYRMEYAVAEIVEKSGVLNGRVPWHPGRGSRTTNTAAAYH